MTYESEVDNKLASSMIKQAKKNLDRMNAQEHKQLIEDASRLLGLRYSQDSDRWFNDDGHDFGFNPLDPERGDLMKVAEAAGLDVDFTLREVEPYSSARRQPFTKGDHQSLAIAILRAASVVLKARGE